MGLMVLIQTSNLSEAMTTDKRTEMQDKALGKLLRYNNLLLKWGTSMGKTRVAVLACDHIVEFSTETPHILIFVAERAHKDNWKKEFIKFLGKEIAESVLHYVTIECYASMKKYTDTEWDFLCLDEVHHIQSEKRQEMLETMKAEYVLALSATPGKAAYDALSWTFGGFEIDEVSLQDAIDEEYLPEPKITVMPLELERLKRTETIEIKMSSRATMTIKDIWSNKWKYLKNKKAYVKYRVIFSCTEKEKYDYINEQFEYWKSQFMRDQDNIALKNRWLQWGSKRKRFLGELKTDKAYALVKSLESRKRRFICFCTSILQADALGGSNAVHSQNSMSLGLLQRFNDKKISSLFAVGMLVEGQNLTQLDDGIIIQLDGNERQFIQKAGRMFRSKEPHIYIFYYKDTRDEEYLNKAISGINPEYIEYKE